MLVGEPDAAVDLDVLARVREVRLRAVRLRETRRDRELLVVLGRGPRGVVRGGLRRLEAKKHVRALVLDRLEGPDGASELVAVLRVLDGHLHRLLAAADALRREAHRRLLERLAQRGRRRRVRPSVVAVTPSNVSSACLRVMSRVSEWRARQSRRVARDGEERDPLGPFVRAARDDDDEVGGVAVDDVGLRAGQLQAVRLEGHAVGVPVKPGLGERERRAHSPDAIGGSSALRSSGVPALRIALAARQMDEKNGVHSSARPISSRTIPSSTNVNPEPPSSSGMWMPVRPSSVAELLPHVRVEALGGLHETPDLGGRRPLVAEAADGRAERVLLFGEGEVGSVPRWAPHAASPVVDAGQYYRPDGSSDSSGTAVVCAVRPGWAVVYDLERISGWHLPFAHSGRRTVGVRWSGEMTTGVRCANGRAVGAVPETGARASSSARSSVAGCGARLVIRSVPGESDGSRPADPARRRLREAADRAEPRRPAVLARPGHGRRPHAPDARGIPLAHATVARARDELDRRPPRPDGRRPPRRRTGHDRAHAVVGAVVGVGVRHRERGDLRARRGCALLGAPGRDDRDPARRRRVVRALLSPLRGREPSAAAARAHTGRLSPA